MDEEANSKDLIFLEAQPHITDFHVISSSAALQLVSQGIWFLVPDWVSSGFVYVAKWFNPYKLQNKSWKCFIKKEMKIDSLNVKYVSVSSND